MSRAKPFPAPLCPRCQSQLKLKENDVRWLPYWECFDCLTAYTMRRRELYRGREPRIQPTQQTLWP